MENPSSNSSHNGYLVVSGASWIGHAVLVHSAGSAAAASAAGEGVVVVAAAREHHATAHRRVEGRDTYGSLREINQFS